MLPYKNHERWDEPSRNINKYLLSIHDRLSYTHGDGCTATINWITKNIDGIWSVTCRGYTNEYWFEKGEDRSKFSMWVATKPDWKK